MLGLTLRDEFRGKRLKGTTVDFTNQSKTGALEVPAAEFLKITYPSHDLLKAIEATGPGQSRPVVLLGDRGQGKSHLLAALYHLVMSPNVGDAWLKEWATTLDNPLIGKLKLRSECHVIAESLHLQRYKHLWDLLFKQHPKGEYIFGKWQGMGDKKTDIPSYDLMIEMFTAKPTVLILDEFQTWYEGLTNTKQYPWQKWAFNFIQILSEIAQKSPELLVLVVSVREGDSDAYQQIHRVNPVQVDFKGPQAKQDRQRLLLYRIFENRMQVPPSKIESLVQPHLSEYFRLARVPQAEQDRRHKDFIEAWPFSPLLLKLLEDQVLIATSAQETRDLIKILVDLFKNVEETCPVITAADFSLTNEKSGVASLLDSVSNQMHKDLREKAIRNLEAVQDAVPDHKTSAPHCGEIISALWLRSLTVDKLVGADPAELQIDITRGKAIDDNQFAGELATIEGNSFNIHRIGARLVFKNEENPEAIKGESSTLGKAKNKSIDATLLIHPDWLNGSPGHDAANRTFGGSVTDNPDCTARWLDERANSLSLIEVRGTLPSEIVVPNTGQSMFTDKRAGTVPKKSCFVCKSSTCGLVQDLLESVRRFGRSAPLSPYVVQGYCPECDADGQPYSGRFFDSALAMKPFISASAQWDDLKDSLLADYWPRSAIQVGAEIGDHDVNGHHYSHWHTMFNSRQLLVLSSLLRSIDKSGDVASEVKETVLGAFQQYIRNQNMFCFWDIGYDKLVPMMSSNSYHPKSNVVENSVFARLGRGNWESCTETLIEGLEWRDDPWETVPTALLGNKLVDFGKVTSKSLKARPNDPIQHDVRLESTSSSDLSSIESGSFDLVITDPPFGNLLQYSELSDFFYSWMRLVLKDKYPAQFSNEYTPKALEAVSNKARHPEGPDVFYQKILAACWHEAFRILKPGGLMAFTFHHSEDEPWVAVLESLFTSGFFLEATFPVRSDETKGDGDFGSQKIEFDIIHVCRKQVDEPKEISWARLRRQIMQDVQQLREILEQHQASGLPEADLQVIRRGKALEYYSRHYGKVYVEKGREFTVREALVGINQLLDDERDTDKESPPVNAEPFTRQFLRLFAGKPSLPRDQMQKYLRGTGVSP